jgi:hypothetical protein
MKEFKFEYFLITLLVIIISAVMFMNPDLTESAKIALAAVTNLITGLAGFMFGIRNPNPGQK